MEDWPMGTPFHLTFDEDGFLPPGIHSCSCSAFRERFGYNPRRSMLISYLFILAKKLAQVGCTQIWIGGSLTTAKENPGDFDGCFDRMEINWSSPKLDPVIADPEAQKQTFGGELIADAMSCFQGQLQTDRSGRPRGIVLIDPRELLGE
jgi:hypothetical protein